MIKVIYLILLNLTAFFSMIIPVFGSFGTTYNIRFIKKNGFKVFTLITFGIAIGIYYKFGINLFFIYTTCFILLVFIYFLLEKRIIAEFNKITLLTFVLSSFVYTIYTFLWERMINIPKELNGVYIKNLDDIKEVAFKITELPEVKRTIDMKISFYINNIAAMEDSFVYLFTLMFIFVTLVYAIVKYKEIDMWEISYIFTLPYIVATLIIIIDTKSSVFPSNVYQIAQNISSCIFVVYIIYGVKEINRYLKNYINNKIIIIFIIICSLVLFGIFYFVFGALQSFRSNKSKYTTIKKDKNI